MEIVHKILEFDPQLASLLPATHSILKSANLRVHPGVSIITLHGSRGLAGGYRPDSDIDLCLIVDMQRDNQSEFQVLLQEILEVTLGNWRSDVEADLAAVFDARKCGLSCFEKTAWGEQPCSLGGIDCFGIYKIQRGFNGFVTNAGVQVKRMYPCLKIWQRT